MKLKDGLHSEEVNKNGKKNKKEKIVCIDNQSKK